MEKNRSSLLQMSRDSTRLVRPCFLFLASSDLESKEKGGGKDPLTNSLSPPFLRHYFLCLPRLERTKIEDRAAGYRSRCLRINFDLQVDHLAHEESFYKFSCCLNTRDIQSIGTYAFP